MPFAGGLGVGSIFGSEVGSVFKFPNCTGPTLGFLGKKALDKLKSSPKAKVCTANRKNINNFINFLSARLVSDLIPFDTKNLL